MVLTKPDQKNDLRGHLRSLYRWRESAIRDGDRGFERYCDSAINHCVRKIARLEDQIEREMSDLLGRPYYLPTAILDAVQYAR